MALMNSYKSLYSKWVFELRYVLCFALFNQEMKELLFKKNIYYGIEVCLFSFGVWNLLGV